MSKSLRTLGFVACWAVGLCAVAQPAAVQRALDAQSAAWNRGDAAAFMAEGYWESPNLVFVGSKGLTEGYEPTLQRYLTSYPNAQAMGHLTFGTLRWDRLGLRHGLLVGTWKLDRTGDHATVSGHFSLVWRRTWKGWRIIADHSS